MVWIEEKRKTEKVVKEDKERITLIKEMQEKADANFDYTTCGSRNRKPFKEPKAETEHEFKEKEDRDDTRNRLLKKSGVEI